MKAFTSIFFFSLALILVQGCKTKPTENSEATYAQPTAAEKAEQDKKDAIQKRDAAQKERHRIATERRNAEEAYYKDSNGMTIYNRTDVAPAYVGGESAMMKYFQDNLKYPAAAASKGWEGTVYVDFIIGTDGKARIARISDETDTDADQSLKDEAIRCVTTMPAWLPGKQGGKPVHVKYSLPVVFKLV